MSWNTDQIKAAYDRGLASGDYSHMIVAYDSFDYENYPIYVPLGADPRDHMPANGDQVDECYRYELGWDAQAAEARAHHWEFV